IGRLPGSGEGEQTRAICYSAENGDGHVAAATVVRGIGQLETPSRVARHALVGGAVEHGCPGIPDYDSLTASCGVAAAIGCLPCAPNQLRTRIPVCHCVEHRDGHVAATVVNSRRLIEGPVGATLHDFVARA